MTFVCPFCQHDGPPNTENRIGTSGWIVFAALLLVCFPLCWIPFVVDAFKEEVRRCGKCGTKLGVA